MSVTAQNVKLVSLTPPAAIIDNASAVVAELDTRDWEYLQIVVYLGASDIAMTALKVTESDTAGSGHTDVTGLIFGTSANTAGVTSTLPSATDDDKFFVFDIDLKGRKRFIDMVATIGDGTLGTFICILGVLSRGHSTPMSAAERGASQILRV